MELIFAYIGGVGEIEENYLPFRNCVPIENELINIHCIQQIYIL